MASAASLPTFYCTHVYGQAQDRVGSKRGQRRGPQNLLGVNPSSTEDQQEQCQAKEDDGDKSHPGEADGPPVDPCILGHWLCKVPECRT